MARLIDADALGRDAFHIKQWGNGIRCVVDWDDIEAAPTVDAVEVVRCKDCAYNENGCCTHSENYDDTRYRPDYFCADGYRRTDGD